MKAFLDEDFLLDSGTAAELYHTWAAPCPIIDYHSHLSPRDIAHRRRYADLTQLWLEGDHYKWRAMRVCAVPERLITGDAPAYEKFLAFARVLPRLVGNPVHHWVHLELQRYFGISRPLTEATAPEIWEQTAQQLAAEGFDAVSLLEKMGVQVLCTTDDPADELSYHRTAAKDHRLPFRMLPSFRPDRFVHIDQGPAWREAAAQLAGRFGPIAGWAHLQDALCQALDRFCALGCRVSDHGFIRLRYTSCGDPDAAVKKALAGQALTEEEIAVYQGALLRFLAQEYTRRQLTMQLHLGALRNLSPYLMSAFGPDAGGDSIGAQTDPALLGQFLGDLEAAGTLPHTILYNLHPGDGAMMATMAASFAANGAKVQYGAAWWHLDHIRGICRQLDLLMETGLLSGSVGMLTDSRSVTSFVRHEYFRRILCRQLGALVERGMYPKDLDVLGGVVEDVCWRNASRFLRMPAAAEKG